MDPIKEAPAQADQREVTAQEHDVLMRASARSGRVVSPPQPTQGEAPVFHIRSYGDLSAKDLEEIARRRGGGASQPQAAEAAIRKATGEQP